MPVIIAFLHVLTVDRYERNNFFVGADLQTLNTS